MQILSLLWLVIITSLLSTIIIVVESNDYQMQSNVVHENISSINLLQNQQHHEQSPITTHSNNNNNNGQSQQQQTRTERQQENNQHTGFNEFFSNNNNQHQQHQVEQARIITMPRESAETFHHDHIETVKTQAAGNSNQEQQQNHHQVDNNHVTSSGSGNAGGGNGNGNGGGGSSGQLHNEQQTAQQQSSSSPSISQMMTQLYQQQNRAPSQQLQQHNQQDHRITNLVQQQQQQQQPITSISTAVPMPQQTPLNQFKQQQQRQISVIPVVPTHPPEQHVPLSNGYHHQSNQPSIEVQNSYHHLPTSPLYYGHNPYIEILRPMSYADDNIVTLNLSHSHIYEIDSDAFVGRKFEYIDLSNNKLGLIHSKSFRIGPSHSKHNPLFTASQYPMNNDTTQKFPNIMANRRPQTPSSPQKSVTIDFSHNPAIVALSGAFDHIDVPNSLLNFTNSTVELKFGAFKKYFKEHPGHLIDVDSVDCCEQEWLLGYKHNFVGRTYCTHDPTLLLSKVSQQTIIDSCIAYVTAARHSMTIQGPSIIHQFGAGPPRYHSKENYEIQNWTYIILGGTAMILTSLSIYIIVYMFGLKAKIDIFTQTKN